MRISDWSSDVCSSDLVEEALASGNASGIHAFLASSDDIALIKLASPMEGVAPMPLYRGSGEVASIVRLIGKGATGNGVDGQVQHGSHRRSEEHTSELQSLMRISYAVFCLKKNNNK